jgi:hypothetical protein
MHERPQFVNQHEREARNRMAAPTRSIIDSRADQMFASLDSGEIEGMRRFGELRRYVEGEILARVLRGTEPADIPVEQPTKFELLFNLNSAQAIGLAISTTFVAGAVSSSRSAAARKLRCSATRRKVSRSGRAARCIPKSPSH